MRTSGSIRTEPDRTEVRTTIRVIYSLISHPVRCRVMVEISISSPIVACMVKVRTIMRSTISTVMIRHTKIEQATVRVIDVHPETPFPSGYINRPIEILGTEKPAILRITQYPAKIVVTDIQSFIIIIQIFLLLIVFLWYLDRFQVFQTDIKRSSCQIIVGNYT